jgi:hypothetical protein
MTSRPFSTLANRSVEFCTISHRFFNKLNMGGQGQVESWLLESAFVKTCWPALHHSLNFAHRHKTFEFRLTDDGAIELHLDGCLRKRREHSGREPQYVWTNVELEWEEHHYVEIRYWASTCRLAVTVNGQSILEQVFPVAVPDSDSGS